MKKQFTILLTAMLLFGAFHSNAQIKIGNIKTPKIGVTKYDKHMKAAEKSEKAGDYIEAYRSYNQALEEKSGDYTAKSARSAIEDKAMNQYQTAQGEFVKKEDCDGYSTSITDMIDNIGFAPNEKTSWENKRDNCKTTIAELNEERINKEEEAKSAEALKNLAKGEGYYSSGFIFNGPKKELGAGDDIVMRVLFEKKMSEYVTEFGLSSGHWAYGYTNIYINGEKMLSQSYSFASNISESWDYIDIPVIIDPKFIKGLSDNPGSLSTPQAIWLLQQSVNPETGSEKYVIAAIPHARKGDFTVSVEFGLGEKGAGKASNIIAKSDVTIKVDEKGLKSLVSKGPRYMRPLLEEEKWTASSSGSSFGMEHVSIVLDLPQTPKYYNQKWCQEHKPATCDYNHGNLHVLIYLDGEPYESLDCEMNGDPYTTSKKIQFLVAPKTDDDMFAWGKKEIALNGIGRINTGGLYISSLVDEINGGKISLGEHKISIKVFAEEVIPQKDYKDVSYKFQEWFDFLNKYACLVEGETTINITKDGIAKYNGKTYLDVPTSKLTKWASLEKQLMAQLSDPNIVVKAVNIRQENWHIEYDAWKTPRFRTIAADVYYYNKKTNSYRYLYGSGIVANYSGGKYEKASWKSASGIISTMNSDSYSIDPGMNYPVPSNLIFK